MSLSQRLVSGFFRALTSLICRIDDSELKRIPMQGPLIIYTNHVNVIEIPIVYTRLQPRRVHGMVLAERWNIPVLNWALDVTETIPLHRGEADFTALREGLRVLERGEVLIIAPEGTRSHDGRLQRAHPGVVLLALHSRAKLVPVAYHGGENYTENLKRFRRTDFRIRVGKPFHLDTHGERVTQLLRQQMVQEMMCQLADLLPPKYRGYYADGSKGSERYIEWEG